MKKFTNKYSKQIEIIISIIGLVLTYITLTHNVHIVNVLVSFETLQVEYHNAKIDSLELVLFFIPVKYRKAIVHFYHAHFCKLAWCNFTFFIAGTIYTNVMLGNPPFYHIGIVAIMEGIVLMLEKSPVQKLHKIIDFINRLFR